MEEWLGGHFSLALFLSSTPRQAFSRWDLQLYSSAWPSLGAALVVWPGLFWVVDQACLLFCWWRQSVWSRMVHTPSSIHSSSTGVQQADPEPQKQKDTLEEGGEKQRDEKKNPPATRLKEKKTNLNYSRILSILPLEWEKEKKIFFSQLCTFIAFFTWLLTFFF